MSHSGIKTLPEFIIAESNSGAKEWEAYKRDFLVHLDALGLDDKPGKRKVGLLLANMGREAVKIYDSFTWAPQIEEDIRTTSAARAERRKQIPRYASVLCKLQQTSY